MLLEFDFWRVRYKTCKSHKNGPKIRSKPKTTVQREKELSNDRINKAKAQWTISRLQLTIHQNFRKKIYEHLNHHK